MARGIEPEIRDLYRVLQSEAKRDATELAQALFGREKREDEVPVSRREFLDYVRRGWMQGAQREDGVWLSPPEWRMSFIEKHGEDRAWQALYDAGLTTVRDPLQAMKQPSLSGPQMWEQALQETIAEMGQT